VHSADGTVTRLGEADFVLTREQIGDHFVFGDLHVSVPEGASLRWPARQHNPYTKDGHSSLNAAKLVLCLPFGNTHEHTVVLSPRPEPQFDGLAFEARDLKFTHSEGPYAKRLDGLGSQFLGRCKEGDWITFELPEVEPGRYELIAEFVLAYSYGIVRVLLDGEQVGEPFDAYWEAVDAEGERVSLGEVDLDAAPHRVTLEIVGKNEKAKGSWISVKRWLLRPVAR